MKPTPAFLKIGVTASTSWLPAGPTVARIFEFDANCCATVDAFDGSSCVSPWKMWTFNLFALFQRVAMNWAQWSWSAPIEAAGPVMGAMTPIVTPLLHEIAVAAVVDAGDVVRAAAPTTTANAATVEAIATSAIFLNVKFFLLWGYPWVRRRSARSVCRAPRTRGHGP